MKKVIFSLFLLGALATGASAQAVQKTKTTTATTKTQTAKTNGQTTAQNKQGTSTTGSSTVAVKPRHRHHHMTKKSMAKKSK